MTDGCSECGEVRGLQKDGKCRTHSKYNDVLCPDCPVSGICSTCFTVRLPLPSRFRDFGTFSKRLLLDICGKVLDPRNENLCTGDVLGCVRDMAQLAMAVKEQPYRELVVINEHGVAHKFSGHFTLDLGFVGAVQSSRQRTHDNKGAPLDGAEVLPMTAASHFAVSPFPTDPQCPPEPPFRAGQMVTSVVDPSAGYDLVVKSCWFDPEIHVLPPRGRWMFWAEGSGQRWKCEAFRVFAPKKAQGAQS